MLLVNVPAEGLDLSDILGIGTAIGFAVGGIFAPVSTWLFLRRVPLWRASVETALFATIAFTVGLIMGSGFVIAAAIAALAALIAAARLKRVYREPAASASSAMK